MRLLINFLVFLLISSVSSSVISATSWQQIDALAQEGKLGDINKQLPLLIKQSRAKKDNKSWRDALLLLANTKLSPDPDRITETDAAVTTLINQPWPNDPDSRLILNLHLAHYLSLYIKDNRWEIRQREITESKVPVPFDKKTMKQFLAMMHQAFAKAYYLSANNEKPLKHFVQPSLKHLEGFFTENTYPEGVRGTIGDTVIYLWVNVLKNSSFWTPEQDSAAKKLLTAKLLATPYREQVNPTDFKMHPLKRTAKLLSDLEQSQLKKGNTEGALEAFRIRIAAVSDIKDSSSDKMQLIHALRLRIKQQINTRKPSAWLNSLRLDLAKKLKDQTVEYSNIQSLIALKPCLDSNTPTRLIAQCRDLEADIKAPYLSLESRSSDGLNKRSIKLRHKNLDTVYFKAWKLGPREAVAKHSYFRNQELIKEKLAQKARPKFTWQSTVKKTADHKTHTTYVTPAIAELGNWLIAASNKQAFPQKEETGSYLVATSLSLSNLVADIRTDGPAVEITTFNGETGLTVSDVSIEAFNIDNKAPIQRAITSPNGMAGLTLPKNKQYNFSLNYQGDSTIVDSINTYNYRRNSDSKVKDALVFTDRAIYRPAQTIQWKIVAYQGNKENVRYRVSPKSKGWVSLYDANDKEVQKIPVTTNHFGSASGEFTVKADRLLGNWRIKTAWGGTKSIKVEEYKRPTFKASIAKPKQALRLGYKAKIKGSVEYYFGGPVTDGNVTWSVKRHHTYINNKSFAEETIANGTVKLNKNGEFTVSFKPESPAKSDDNKYFRYALSADITDSGGETRSTNRTFSIGTTTVQTEISQAEGFVIAGKPFQLTINRQDLDGNPNPGSGFWSLHPILQPEKILMPSELTGETVKKRFATKGDALLSRWEGYQGFEGYTKDWRNGKKIAQGSVRHDASGFATITNNLPNAGLYRLRYATKDKWGRLIKTDKIIVASNQKRTNIKVPVYLKVAKPSAQVGENISLLAGSGFLQAPSLLEVFHGNKLVSRSIQSGGVNKQLFTVTPAHRGGLSFVLTMVKDHQLIRQEEYVSVPWKDRELNVSFSTFRDKLRPGQKETWRVSVKDANNKPLERAAAEVLASMFDNSLELFGTHSYPSTSPLYPSKRLSISRSDNLGSSSPAEYFTPPYKSTSPNPYSSASLRLGSSFLKQYDCHSHLGNAKTNVVGHCHKSNSPEHIHTYGNGKNGNVIYKTRVVYKPVYKVAKKRALAPRAPAPQQVDVFALQTKLSAQGYYKGPIDGVVGSGTRAALQQFMQNRDGGAGASTMADGETATPNADTANLDNIQFRKNFNETAFFKPHLLLEKDGSVTFEFEVPESLTQWKVWVSAITRDLKGGSTSALSRTSKALMVRPYLPRFLRAGDEANIEVVINNTEGKPLTGKMSFDIIDPVTDKTIASNFKLNPQPRAFNVAPGQSKSLRYSIIAPKDLGLVTIRAKARASDGTETFSDGEQRGLPILPSRIHLAQSRFAAMQGNSKRVLKFNELARNTDATRINDKLVVNVDGQLLYSTLNALPYLTQYPYECTEQTMNRFLSTSIINQTFSQTPQLAAIRKQLAKRGNQLAKWSAGNKDANNRILLEETPWLNHASGNTQSSNYQLLNILDPVIASAQQKSALAKLAKAQNEDGGFPWWDGGNSSPYMTRYLLQNFAKAIEFNIAVPKATVQRAWKYLHNNYENEVKETVNEISHVKRLSTLSYMLSSFKDNSWTNGAFSNTERQRYLTLHSKDG